MRTITHAAGTALRTALLLASLICMAACSSGGSEEAGAIDQPPPSGGSSSNGAPSISGSPPASVTVEQSYSFRPEASDPDGDPITFGIRNKPAWANFNTATGEISGTPRAGDAGTYSDITLTASDGSASDSMSFSITVTQNATGSVTLSWTPPTANTDGSALTDLSGYRIYYGNSSGQYPNRITIDNAGLTTYVVENLDPDTYYFSATAVNASGVESEFSNETVRTVAAN